MEVMKVSANPNVLDFDFTSLVDGELGAQLSNGVEGSEAPEDDLLNDLDSYMDDIKERLTISRMVSDSVVRGVVKAVEYEAAERIAAKELEVVAMKGALQSCSVNTNKNQVLGPQVFLKEHGAMRESLICLGRTAKDQLKILEKEIGGAKECNSIRKISSSPESLLFSGVSHENAPQRWTGIDKLLQALNTTLEATYNQLDSVIYIPGALLSQWQQEQELQGEVEAMVIGNSIQSIREEYEEKLQDHNAQFCCERGRVRFGEMFNDMSSILQELNMILKLLSTSEVGHLTTHGYPSTEEGNKNAKRIDNLHHKVLGNEKQDSKISLPENSESLQLMHMSKEDLYKYFKAEMTKLKRNHESEVLRMTEENFGLKRELLNKRESSLPFKKDREFEILRKKIPEVVLRLEQILVEVEKLLSCRSNAESHGRVEALFLENLQLKDVVENKKKEVKCLSSSISDAEEKISQKTMAEAYMVKMTRNLTDAHIETLVREDVYECILKEVIGQINADTEQFNLETSIMQNIYQSIFREAVHSADITLEFRNVELAMESAIIHELCTIIFQEAFRDAVTEFDSLKALYSREAGHRVSLERKIWEADKARGLVYEEKEKLKQEIFLMASKLLDKDKLAQESLVASEKQREQFQQVSRDLHSAREQLKEQKILVVNRCKELDLMKGDYNEAAKRIDLYEKEIGELNEKLKEQDLESRTNLKSIILIVNGLLSKVAAFECKVKESLKWTNTRLRNSTSELHSLIQKANSLRMTGALYKKRLEKRSLDLQKAEAEVDLLGDEVDTFSSLLEKIYIALDHYSPILQHYPGIMEILKLIRRELSVESAKHV